MDEEEEVKHCLCIDCLYGSQPYGYFPIVCVHGKRSKDMWREVFTCRHFERCPDQPTDSEEDLAADTSAGNYANLIQMIQK